MTTFLLDHPQVIEDPVESTATYHLANQDVAFQADARANLTNFFWPWANATYAKSISITLSAPREDEFVPMIANLHPGYLETIISTRSTEGVIVSKQLTAPLGSSYDRSAIWLIECQAEGDRILRVDVEIDWGEPLEQRMVDGLLVAQVNPGPAQGIYEQKNADSTRVFGNPEGRPDSVDIDDPQRTHLVYHVLVNGEVEFQFLLTVSDVGEQVAWNGFLALRDAARVAEKSGQAWQGYLNAGRLWTPDAELNHLLNASKIAAIQALHRLRTGMVPTERRLEAVPSLVSAWDIFEPIQSRNLLAHLRRLAEKTNGRLPIYLPLRRKDEPDDPGPHILQTNTAYLTALADHLAHRFDADLLERHYVAIGLCAEMIVRHMKGNAPRLGLEAAAKLAMLYGDESNSQRWFEIDYQNHGAVPVVEQSADLETQLDTLAQGATWASDEEGVWQFQDRNAAAAIVGHAIWHYAGLDLNANLIQVQPKWIETQSSPWSWWALMDLPLTEETVLSLVWDGSVLHSNQPVNSVLPVRQHHAIQTVGTDEDSFALEFVFIDKTDDNTETKQSFKPELS